MAEHVGRQTHADCLRVLVASFGVLDGALHEVVADGVCLDSGVDVR